MCHTKATFHTIARFKCSNVSQVAQLRLVRKPHMTPQSNYFFYTERIENRQTTRLVC